MGIENLADILREHATSRPDRIALVLGDRQQTWSELYERASRVAAGLGAATVGPQDRIAFLDKNGIEHFEVFFGAALANAVCVDVNWRLAAPEVEFIVNDAQAKVFVVGPDFVPVLDAIADSLTTVGTILVIGGHAKYQDYDEWVAEHPPADPQAPSGPTDVAPGAAGHQSIDPNGSVLSLVQKRCPARQDSSSAGDVRLRIQSCMAAMSFDARMPSGNSWRWKLWRYHQSNISPNSPGTSRRTTLRSSTANQSLS